MVHGPWPPPRGPNAVPGALQTLQGVVAATTSLTLCYIPRNHMWRSQVTAAIVSRTFTQCQFTLLLVVGELC